MKKSLIAVVILGVVSATAVRACAFDVFLMCCLLCAGCCSLFVLSCFLFDA